MKCPVGLHTYEQELVRDVTVRVDKVELRLLKEGNKTKSRISGEQAMAC